MKIIIISLFSLLINFNTARASDHIDGVPSLTLHEQVDLTDLYVFQNGQDKRSISIVLNLYPGVSDSGHFSSKVFYNVKLRAVYLNSPSASLTETDPSHEAVINCSFTDPGHHHHGSSNEKSQVTCNSLIGRAISSSITADVGEIKMNADESMKIFTGPRSDPFFITREHFDGVTKRQSFPGFSDDNLMETINVLSIVLEVDMTKLFPDYDGKLFSVAAESLAFVDGEMKVLDRVGRPEITNLSLHALANSKPLKRKYNQTEAYFNREEDRRDFKIRLIDNIYAYDTMDNELDWNTKSIVTLAETLLDDYLVFSTDPQCISSSNNFLGIEKQVFIGSEANSCGGRRLSDDIMNTLYALYIGGLSGSLNAFETGVNRPYQSSNKSLSSDFPYLALPEEDSFWNVKRHLLNTVIKAGQE